MGAADHRRGNGGFRPHAYSVGKIGGCRPWALDLIGGYRPLPITLVITHSYERQRLSLDIRGARRYPWRSLCQGSRLPRLGAEGSRVSASFRDEVGSFDSSGVGCLHLVDARRGLPGSFDSSAPSATIPRRRSEVLDEPATSENGLASTLQELRFAWRCVRQAGSAP